MPLVFLNITVVYVIHCFRLGSIYRVSGSLLPYSFICPKDYMLVGYSLFDSLFLFYHLRHGTAEYAYPYY